MIQGYARVSTSEQNLDAQLDALRGAGAGRVFADKISGSFHKCSELDRLLDQLREGHVVVVTMYDQCALAQEPARDHERRPGARRGVLPERERISERKWGRVGANSRRSFE